MAPRLCPAPLACVAVLLALAGCGSATETTAGSPGRPAAKGAKALPGSGKPLVTIGDKNFTEQFVLGELYAQALSARGYSVVVNRDIGPTEVTLQALYSGRLSLYPEYLSTWNTAVAGYKHQFGSPRSALRAARRYARAHGLVLLRPTPFSDTTAIAVNAAYGGAHNLHSLRDLRRVAQQVTLGAPPQFQQQPHGGLTDLEQAYGFGPATFRSLAIGAQYEALDQGTIQAADVNTTDGQLRGGGYTLLRDPQRVFGFGQVIPVVPRHVIAQEGAAFLATINRVDSLLTLDAIRRLNAAVDVGGQDPKLVAKRFLQAHGLLPTSAG